MRLPLLILIIIVILPGAWQPVCGQYKQHQPFRDYYAARAIGNERVAQRFYFGVGKHFAFGDAQLRFLGPDSTGKWMDMDYDRKLHAAKSFMFQAGTFLPITLISDQSAIALNIELMFSYAEMDHDSVVFYPKATFHKPIPYVIAGIPLSIDFKTGGDVSLSKVRGQMFAFGVGAVSGISTPSILIRREGQLPVTSVPFVKAEIGFFAGLAFKLRGVAYLRNAININRSFYDVFAEDEIVVKMRAGYGYHLSLIVMPFSHGWRTEEWY